MATGSLYMSHNAVYLRHYAAKTKFDCILVMLNALVVNRNMTQLQLTHLYDVFGFWFVDQIRDRDFNAPSRLGSFRVSSIHSIANTQRFN